jgi:uncharacterized protein
VPIKYGKHGLSGSRPFGLLINMNQEQMECRENCGACCIVPSISSPLPDYPEGKKAGVICPHLTQEFRCRLFGSDSRPRVCSGFKAEPQICGKSREEAIEILTWLEGESIG